MACRFVILHHRLAGSEHWDLMLERGDVLLTWRLLTEPVGRASLPILAEPIGDHRKAYLDHEGPVSGDRGDVRRVEAGTVELAMMTPDCVRFTLSGTRLCGRFVLRRSPDGWVFDTDD